MLDIYIFLYLCVAHAPDTIGHMLSSWSSLSTPRLFMWTKMAGKWPPTSLLEQCDQQVSSGSRPSHASRIVLSRHFGAPQRGNPRRRIYTGL